MSRTVKLNEDHLQFLLINQDTVRKEHQLSATKFKIALELIKLNLCTIDEDQCVQNTTGANNIIKELIETFNNLSKEL